MPLGSILVVMFHGVISSKILLPTNIQTYQMAKIFLEIP